VAEPTADIGLTGLAVLGSNLVRNMAPDTATQWAVERAGGAGRRLPRLEHLSEVQI